MKFQRKVFTLTAITATAFGLAACTVPVEGTRYGTLVQEHKVTRSIDHDLLTEMQNEGVQVIQQGSRLILVLPTDKFFVLTSTQLKDRQAPTLEMISLYLRNYIKKHHTVFPIKVYAYTDEVPTRADRYDYSNQYAQVIAAYMWSHGFTPQQMQVVGYGAEHAIANNRTAAGSAYNRRVVIQVN